MKTYVIIAGVNGAGKTTLYQTNEEYATLPRINLDEIVRDIGSWKNASDIFAAGKIAVKRIKDYFTQGISFNQETTLCGRSILMNIDRAKGLGYEIDLSFVGLENVELAKARVAQRVRDGGHGIPESDIERRYRESLINLRRIIPECDRVRIYDNTSEFRLIALFRNGICLDRSDYIPQWCTAVLGDSEE